MTPKKDNELRKEESPKNNEEGQKQKSKKEVIKVDTKKGIKNKQKEIQQTPTEITPSKFLGTGEVDPAYVTSLEENVDKSRTHILILMQKYGEITQWVLAQRKWLMDAGFDLQTRSKDTPNLLNIVNKNYDGKFIQDMVRPLLEQPR